MRDDMRSHYPELVEAADLSAALLRQSAVDGRELTLEPDQHPHSARVLSARGTVEVDLATRERSFQLSLWSRGVNLARGDTADITEVVGICRAWEAGACLADLRAAWPLLSYTELAEAHERGDAVEVKWRMLLENGDPHLRPLIEAALTEPRLRELFPFTSRRALLFSRCTGYPYLSVPPVVLPLGAGRYRVVGPDDTVLGEDDAAGAVAVAVAALPADCGPAVPGTAEDLRTE
ncbi:DUF6193 family natural product biosynthesis protein [Allokutzneria oryzae]|uniref:DUF6193 family natural product biosynthesis protein n=1 Tax=Allokutzneria oryzae TaxID=1378989 RepID=A0ABV6A1H2_9PSEU